MNTQTPSSTTTAATVSIVPTTPICLSSNGSNQEGRKNANLDPQSVNIDERSLADLLDFTYAYSKELKYYDQDNQATGDWSGFLNPDGADWQTTRDALLQYLDNSENRSENDSFQRPHLLLFMAYLKLLQMGQQQLNQLTQRHLDFYYRDYLRLTKLKAVPDSVNVLVSLAAGTTETLLPAGTLLAAGKDGAGNDMSYATGNDLLVNLAQVKQLSSVFVNKTIIGIKQARELATRTLDNGLMDMLAIPYGSPNPGDPLPPYPVPTYPANWAAGDMNSIDTSKGITVDDALLKNLLTLTDFVSSTLHMEFDEFRLLMKQVDSTTPNWLTINNLLARAAQRANFNPTWTPSESEQLSSIDAYVANAVGSFNYSALANMGIGGFTTLDQFNVALQLLVQYFYCPAEQFQLLMQTYKNTNATEDDWDQVYANLQTAYVKKIQAQQKQQLKDISQQTQLQPIITQQTALEQMLKLALNPPENTTDDDLLSKLSTYLPPSSTNALSQIQQAMGVNAQTLDDNGWDGVIKTFMLAWNNRLGSDPVPQKEEWVCLNANPDAKTVLPTTTSDIVHWRTFGQQVAPAQSQMPTPQLGLIIASPVLCLSQGIREVSLVIKFDSASFDPSKLTAYLSDTGQCAFIVEISSQTGWISANNPLITMLNYDTATKTGSDTDSDTSGNSTKLNALQFQFTLDASSPAVNGLADSPSTWPMLRLLLQSYWKESTSEDQGGHYVTPYPLFSSLALERVWLNVSVKGLKDLPMQNDEASLSSSKPFEPFGNAPAVGSSFSFAHQELAVKCLDTMTLNFEWMKFPDINLGTYYKNYPALKDATDNGKFTFAMTLLNLSLPIPLSTNQIPLFTPNNVGTPSSVSIPVGSAFAPASLYEPDTSLSDYSDHSAWRRYWRLELNPIGFQQDVYPSLASKMSLQFAADIAAGKNAEGKTPSADDYQINPPYTPTLKTFTVDYTASKEILMSQYPDANALERIYHQHPFGYAEISQDDNGAFRLLPAYDYEGELYLGLEGIESDKQSVSLLFQLADGSANPDLPPQPVQWSYLSGNQWLTLQKGQLQSDSTQGLNVTGIMQFQLPQAQPNTLLPADLYWLRAAVIQNCDSLCDTISIDTQAVCATWVDQGNQTDHLNQALPVQTINQTVDSLPGIASISQPYSSFGGKPEEDYGAFYIRVSERLRHKQRALTFWDYEHLILNQFPEIYTAKCIPQASTGAVGSGQVTVVVIPDIRNKKPSNPFAPKVSSGLLEQIQNYLADCLPPLAKVTVKNPTYVPVKVRFEVSFMPGCDPGFYTAKLNNELRQFLSPWAYDNSSEVVIGGNIYANNIINFLENRTYVDYVAGMELFKCENGLTYSLVPPPIDRDSGYCVTTIDPSGVLVSAQQHVIDLITEDHPFEDSDLMGIGYMEIGLDFIVAPNPVTATAA